MNSQPLISIAIPTYNRAVFLENLLNHIAPQAQETGDLVQICISNNCSTDNTREVIIKFMEKYPDLIRYNENEKNLGIDRNLLKVMEMAQGDFVWLLGDDDMMVNNGIKKVIDFINTYCNKNTGLIILGHEAYFIDSKTGKKIVHFDTIEKDKSKIYNINRKDIIGLCYPSDTFISALLFNNTFLKIILKEEKAIIQEAIKAKDYVHAFLYQLMFLKYPHLEALKLNETIIDEDLHYYKFYVEDKFGLHYAARKELADLLLSSKYTDDYYRKIITHGVEGLTKSFIIEMGVMKSFRTLNYLSFFGCVKIFFLKAPLTDALLFSLFFIFFNIVPSVVLRNLYKLFIRIRLKDWQKTWSTIVVTNSKMSKGSRRLLP